MDAQLFGQPIIVVVLVVIIVAGIVLYFVVDRFGRPAESTLQWHVMPDEGESVFRPDRAKAVKDTGFMERVARRIEEKTKCLTARDGDFIHVYKKQKLIGIVMCCEDGHDATPATVRTLVELAEHFHVNIMYLATKGPAPLDTQKFARLQKVKLISV